MIKNTVLICFLFVFCFLVFLVAMVPASVIWKHFLYPYTPVSSIGLQAKAFTGTIWNGRAHLSFRHIEGVLAWEMNTFSLSTAALPLRLNLKSSAGELEANLEASLSEQTLTIERVDLELSELNPFVRTNRIKMDGEFFGKDIALTVSDQRLVSASGSFSWSGGDVSYPAGRSMHERSLPQFSGRLSTEQDGNIRLAIRDSNASFDMMRGALEPTGMATWEVTRRMLDIANEPWAANSNETDVVFKIKKDLYKG